MSVHRRVKRVQQSWHPTAGRVESVSRPRPSCAADPVIPHCLSIKLMSSLVASTHTQPICHPNTTQTTCHTTHSANPPEKLSSILLIVGQNGEAVPAEQASSGLARPGDSSGYQQEISGCSWHNSCTRRASHHSDQSPPHRCLHTGA